MKTEREHKFLVNLIGNEVCILPEDVSISTCYDWYPVVISGHHVETVIADNFSGMSFVEINDIPVNNGVKYRRVAVENSIRRLARRLLPNRYANPVKSRNALPV